MFTHPWVAAVACMHNTQKNHVTLTFDFEISSS